ncbi:hypothetical protein GC387_33525 [Pseudomonas sp. MWU12-2323]|nr:hypothetical protein [Pseudomonas sp. MWU12-2323]
MVSTVVIYKDASIIRVDEVSFCIRFEEVRVESGHPSGPVFICGAARAVISDTDANLLVAAGVTDRR